MKRRSFIQKTSAAAFLTGAGAGLLTNLQAKNLAIHTPAQPYHFTGGTSRQMPGFLLNFIVSKEQTDGAYALIEGKARKGGEPPMHVHEHEDEAFYMLEGEMIVTIGEEDFHVKPGEYIFLPRKIPHTQRFLTDTVHVLLMISPAGLEEFFRTATIPAVNAEIPPLPTAPPTEEEMKMMMELNAAYGISPVTK